MSNKTYSTAEALRIKICEIIESDREVGAEYADILGAINMVNLRYQTEAANQANKEALARDGIY
jgi:hypothetical protein